MQTKVQAALDRSEGIKPAPATTEAAPVETPAETPAETSTQAPTPPAPVEPQPVTGGSLGSMSEGYVANESEDLGAVC